MQHFSSTCGAFAPPLPTIHLGYKQSLSLLDKLTLTIRLTAHIKMAAHTIFGNVGQVLSWYAFKWFLAFDANWQYFWAEFLLLKILA